MRKYEHTTTCMAAALLTPLTSFNGGVFFNRGRPWKEIKYGNVETYKSELKSCLEGMKRRMKVLVRDLIGNVMLNWLKVSMKFFCEGLIRNVILRG